MVALVALCLLVAAAGPHGARSEATGAPNGIADVAKAKLSKAAVPNPPSELESRGVLPEGATWSDFAGLQPSEGATPLAATCPPLVLAPPRPRAGTGRPMRLL